MKNISRIKCVLNQFYHKKGMNLFVLDLYFLNSEYLDNEVSFLYILGIHIKIIKIINAIIGVQSKANNEKPR